MIWLFWSSVAFLAYTFAGYPAMLWALSKVRNRDHQRSEILPRVSVLITAYNEGARLRQKLANTVALDYPKEKLELIVASDGSEDDTVQVVESFADRGVRLLLLDRRHGKNHAQMLARDVSSGEILVFTDVSVQLAQDALRSIVANFADSTVACVSSEDRVAPHPENHGGEGAYVGLEMWLRRLESRIGSVVTASGSFFAARRELCAKWHADQTSDFFIPLHAVEEGKRTVVDRRSLGSYGLARQSGIEFHRKVRTIVNGLHVFFTHARLLNPLRYPLTAWQLVSHKLCRWLVPFGMAGLLIASVFLYNAGWFYRGCAVLQVGLYGVGSLALLWGRLLKIRGIKLASFFILGNAATLAAWAKFWAGERFVVWQPTQRA